MNNYCVYRHTSPSGKVYIGITHNSPEERWKNGFGYAHQKHFFSAIKKYGWDNFKHEVLYQGLSETEAKKKEIELIAEHRSIDRNFGYNLTTGGDGVRGYDPPPEVRKKISEANKGRICSEEVRRKIAATHLGMRPSEGTREKLRNNHADISGEKNPMFGKNHSEESRRKMSETRKRLFAEGVLKQESKPKKPKMSPEERTVFFSKRMSGQNNPSYGKGKGVVQYSLAGEKLREYDTIREAERETSVDHTMISRCCKNKQRFAGGYLWKYKGD